MPGFSFYLIFHFSERRKDSEACPLTLGHFLPRISDEDNSVSTAQSAIDRNPNINNITPPRLGFAEKLVLLLLSFLRSYVSWLSPLPGKREMCPRPPSQPPPPDFWEKRANRRTNGFFRTSSRKLASKNERRFIFLIFDTDREEFRMPRR